MRVESGYRKRRAEDLSFTEILLVANNCSYNFASRYLNVTLESLKRFLEKNHPDLHARMVQNGRTLNTKPYREIRNYLNAKK